jgi:hypothetical protein
MNLFVQPKFFTISSTIFRASARASADSGTLHSYAVLWVRSCLAKQDFEKSRLLFVMVVYAAKLSDSEDGNLAPAH